jgi:hypothetical protein
MDTHDKQRAELTQIYLCPVTNSIPTQIEFKAWVKDADTLYETVSCGQRDHSAEAMGY